MSGYFLRTFPPRGKLFKAMVYELFLFNSIFHFLTIQFTTLWTVFVRSSKTTNYAQDQRYRDKPSIIGWRRDGSVASCGEVWANKPAGLGINWISRRRQHYVIENINTNVYQYTAYDYILWRARCGLTESTKEVSTMQQWKRPVFSLWSVTRMTQQWEQPCFLCGPFLGYITLVSYVLVFQPSSCRVAEKKQSPELPSWGRCASEYGSWGTYGTGRR
jgi:hypothetical protein